MTAAWDPVEAARLAAEHREDDARMTPAPWEWDDGFLWNRDADIGVLNHAGTDWPVSEADAAGIARLRNNARPTAEQIEAATVEVAAKQRGYDDLHAMIPGSGDIWSKVVRLVAERDQLRAEMSRMRPVVEHAETLRDQPILVKGDAATWGDVAQSHTDGPQLLGKLIKSVDIYRAGKP